jgi:cell division protein FtsA
LKGTKMFGIGGRNFTKRLAIELNIAFEEAEKLKRAYAEDKLDQKSKKIINTVLENDIETWLEGVVLSLSEFKKTKVLPSKILLSGGGANLPEIKNALNNRKWYKKLAFVHTPHASFIRPGDLKNLIDESKSINNHQNITVASLVNIGIELSGEETLIQKTLRKVIGIMKV